MKTMRTNTTAIDSGQALVELALSLPVLLSSYVE